jgi:tetratricopeptide (TPR) repeat protein
MNRCNRLFLVATLLANLLPLRAQTPQSSAPVSGIPRVPPPSANLSVQELEEEGDALRAQKDYLDAMDYYQTGMKKSPSAVLHNKLGVCLIQLSRFSEAKKQFEIAVKMDGQYPEARNNLGVSYYELKRYGSAVKEYKRAIKLKDNNASFHVNLGSAYFSRQDYDDAGREFNRALQIDPQIFEPQPSGGVSVKLATSGDRAFFHYTLAKMYGSRGDLERCQLYLSKANEEGYPYIKDALKDNGFAKLRENPNFVSFVRSLKPPSAESQ